MNVRVNHPTDRPNFTRVDVGELTIWFSYETQIAFHTYETGTVVHENDWGPTTGKHLNAIDGGDKKSRVTREAFDAAFREQFGREAAAA